MRPLFWLLLEYEITFVPWAFSIGNARQPSHLTGVVTGCWCQTVSSQEGWASGWQLLANHIRSDLGCKNEWTLKNQALQRSVFRPELFCWSHPQSERSLGWTLSICLILDKTAIFLWSPGDPVTVALASCGVLVSLNGLVVAHLFSMQWIYLWQDVDFLLEIIHVS